MPKTKPDPKRTIHALLGTNGQTFSEELGIDVEKNSPSALFCLLFTSLLFSARIGHNIATQSARVLIHRGWTTPEKMVKATWDQRAAALREGGYTRYDERTSTMLEQTAQLVIDRYHGNLRKLRNEAEKNVAEAAALLTQFKGIGEVGANIFLREVQVAWPEVFPFADAKALAGAKRLGLPSDPEQLSKLVRGRKQFARLVAALVRVQLERKHADVIAQATSESRP